MIIDSVLAALMSLEAAVLSTAVFLSAAVVRWRLRKSGNETADEVMRESEKAEAGRDEAVRTARNLAEYVRVDPETGLTSQEAELAEMRSGLEEKQAEQVERIEKEIAVRGDLLRSGETELFAARRALADASAMAFGLVRTGEEVAESVRIAQAVGRLDDDRNVIDGKGLPPDYGDVLKRAFGETEDALRHLGEGPRQELGELAKEVDSMREEAAVLKRSLNDSAAPTGSRVLQSGIPVESAVSVKEAIGLHLERKNRRQRERARGALPARGEGPRIPGSGGGPS
ncbi:hypothetical protein GCM10027294_02030 [Marinactinospora endophytica]